jgi:hypothetical protein
LEGNIPEDWKKRRLFVKGEKPGAESPRGGRRFKGKNWMPLGNSMENSAAFPVIVSNGNAPIGVRREKALLPNFRKILALARFSRWKNQQSKVDTI